MRKHIQLDVSENKKPLKIYMLIQEYKNFIDIQKSLNFEEK